MIIAISGKPGAGTSTIAKKLAEKLGSDYFSPGHFFKEHSEGKETQQALDVWKTRRGSSRSFHELIDRMQKERAKDGNVVICGKLSIHFLKDVADMKIWIDCSLDERAKRSAKRDKIGLEKAKRRIKERERIETEEWKRIYGFDRSKQKEIADLVIDSTGLTEKETLDRILKELDNL